MNSQHTTDDIFPSSRASTTQEQPIRFLDIHIYEPEPAPEDPPSVESQREPEPAPLDESEDTEPGQPHRKQRRYIIALCVGVVCLSVVIALVIVSFLPLLTPDTIITLVPSTQQIRTTTNIIVNPEQTTGTQVPGRALAAITMNQARTIATTGKGHQDAKAGHGYITFYNAAPYPQTITVGTILTGVNGIQIVTDQDATIAAVRYPTLGQTTVAAHAVITGPASNIAGGDIYGPCCRLNVSAVNSAFSGGQQARDYQTVTPQDITTVAASLKTSLNQSVQAALQTQVHSDETLITPLPCQQSVKPDQQPGEEAAHVSIAISETCTGMTYNTQAYQNRIMQIANKQAGEGYNPIGQIQSTIIQAIAQKHNRTALLEVTLAETYTYQVSQQQQQQIKTRIAGENKAQAINTLLRIPGIQSVSVSSATLPTDTNHIRIIIVYTG